MNTELISDITLIVQTVFMAAYGAPQFREAIKKKKQRKPQSARVYGIAYNSGKGSINHNQVLIPKHTNGSVGIIGNTNDGDIIGNVFYSE
jgi:hypothetical protein